MRGLLVDLLRAVVDGLGRDPVDRHAAEAAAVVNGATRGRATATHVAVPARPMSPPPPPPAPAPLAARLAEKNGEVVAITGPIPDDNTMFQLGITRAELRRFQRAYGRASETIGEQRGVIARLQFERRAAEDNARNYLQEIGRLNAELADTGSGVTREGLGHDLAAAWHSLHESSPTHARWEMVADAAIRAIRPRPGHRPVVGLEFETACHGLARALHHIEPADSDHAERLDEWAHADGQQLAAELGRRGLGLIRIGATP